MIFIRFLFGYRIFEYGFFLFFFILLFINFLFIVSNDCLVEIKIVVMSVNKFSKIIYLRVLCVVLYNFSMG